jgi:hypothetical protein
MPVQGAKKPSRTIVRLIGILRRNSMALAFIQPSLLPERIVRLKD